MPDVVPIFIEGFDMIMNEERKFPRFIPRPFQNVRVTFGEKLDMEEVFGDLRARWKQLRAEEERKSGTLDVGVLNDALKYSDEAVKIRIECTDRIRKAVLDVRRQRGYSDEDPKNNLASTWLREGMNREGPRDRRRMACVIVGWNRPPNCECALRCVGRVWPNVKKVDSPLAFRQQP